MGTMCRSGTLEFYFNLDMYPDAGTVETKTTHEWGPCVVRALLSSPATSTWTWAWMLRLGTDDGEMKTTQEWGPCVDRALFLLLLQPGPGPGLGCS